MGKKRNLIFTEEYFSGVICLPGKERTKATKFNEYQLTLFSQSWNYLQKIKVDVFVERHLKITKKSLNFGRQEILRNYLKTSTLFIRPAQPGVH